MTMSLLLAGCGKMGGALLGGWLQRGISAEQITIVDPNAETRDKLFTDYGVNTCAAPEQLQEDLKPNVVMLAVKPQAMDSVVPLYARFKSPDCVFLSIAAGKTIAYFERHLGHDAAIIRAMPNTPAAVRRGITVTYANSQVVAHQRDLGTSLLQAVGSVEWIDDEALIDAVTALSGSGPAYVFLMVECMARAGMDAGLPEDLAMKLARQTVAGSGELLHQASETAQTLRQNVTSPGGTTAEALAVLMSPDGLQALMSRAIIAAARRSRELAG